MNLDTEHITLDGTVTGSLKKSDDKNVDVAGDAKDAGDGTASDDGKSPADAKPVIEATAKDSQS